MNKKVMLMAAMGAAMASCGIDIDKELNRSYSFKPMTPSWKERKKIKSYRNFRESYKKWYYLST